MKKNFADFLREEASKLDGMVYFSQPYSCCIDEACMYFSKYNMPDEKSMTIDRIDNKHTTISIKPIKGSGKRKPFVIKIWVT